MKVIICAVNSKYIHSSLAPWCLAGGLEKYAPEIEYSVIEGTINESIDDIFNRLISEKCDLIGFCTYIWNKSIVLSLCEKIKAYKNVLIALGGPEVSYNPKEILSNSNVDFVLSGEGELSFAQLCKGKDKETINGLCYREENEIFEAQFKEYSEKYVIE